jgi:hypothetical protein
MLLTLLEGPHAEARFKAADPSFKGYQRTLRAIASQLALELDARYGLRKEISHEGGHGVYVEDGPLGTVGVGLGHVRRRKLSNGSTKAAHTGLGVYLRTNVFTKAEVSSSNRLAELADMARKAAAAATVAA